jgi:hypothetical protein
MSEKPIYLMIASMDVEPEYEALFHEVYDTEHVPFLSQVLGVISVRRYQREALTMNIGGQRQTIHLENEPKHMVIYEIESPEVLTSAAWNEAVEKGRWPTEVRPHTRNRRHVLMKLNSPRA